MYGTHLESYRKHYFCVLKLYKVNPKYKTAIYFFFVFLGGGLLLFREDIKGETQIVVTVIAVCVMMFGLYKVTSSQMSNQQRAYKNQEYFNREKYSEQEDELEEE